MTFPPVSMATGSCGPDIHLTSTERDVAIMEPSKSYSEVKHCSLRQYHLTPIHIFKGWKSTTTEDKPRAIAICSMIHDFTGVFLLGTRNPSASTCCLTDILFLLLVPPIFPFKKCNYHTYAKTAKSIIIFV